MKGSGKIFKQSIKHYISILESTQIRTMRWCETIIDSEKDNGNDTEKINQDKRKGVE